MINQALFIRRVFIQTCLGGIVFVTSACIPATPPAENQQTPPPTCVSPSLNPYRSHPLPNQVSNIFSNYKNGLITYDIARQEAFSQLGKNIKQWSDYEDVLIDDQHTIRISITYLDPMLVQYTVLNYALVPPNNFMDTNWFIAQEQAAMDRLANRHEILFMITVTSPSYPSVVKVNLPINELRLKNASEMKVQLTHHDPMLGEPIDITREPLYGVVGYPVSVALQDCTGIIDQWTNELTLGFELSTQQAESPYASLSWNIPFQSLVSITPQANNHPAPTMDSSYDINRFNIATAPPTPNWSNPQASDIDSIVYWEEMGRYIWSKVLMEINH